MVVVTQSGLGLPDRDYYLKDDAVYAALRAKYVAHIGRMLTLAGEPNSRRRRRSRSSSSRRSIAKLHWPAAKRRERDLTYNPRTRVELEQMAPGFFWETLLATEGVDAQPQFVVRELDAVQALAQLFLQVPVDTWRSYFRYHYLVSVGALLPHAFDEESFDFYGRTLQGPAAAARAQQARGGGARQRPRRGGRRAVRGALLPGLLEASRCARWWRTCAPPTPSASSSCPG